jgi:GMP synthase (glutamine-hydrolysing)
MSRKALLVIQMDKARDDRVAGWLKRHGYALDYRFPAKGDPLPDPAMGEHELAVVYGGPQSANETAEKPYLQHEIDFIRGWCDRERPLLGLCLGAQLLGKAYGGAVGPHPDGLNEIGYADIQPTDPGRALIPGPMRVFHWHTEGVATPPGGERLAEGAVFPNQAFRLGDHAYGLQFHPETTVEIFSTWIEEAGHMLEWPGAQPRDAIFADAKRHDPPLARWLEGFMQRFVGER